MTGLLRRLSKIIVILFLSSCTVNSPIIKDHEWEIVLNDDRELNLKYESLSLELYIYDEDGQNDIETIFIINDEYGIYWELNESSWDTRVEGEEKWYSSRMIYMQNYGDIPRTPYRIHVRDLAGEFTEDKIFITQPKVQKESINFPDLEYKDGVMLLKNYSSGTLQVEEDGRIVLQGAITETGSSVEEIIGEEFGELPVDTQFFVESELRGLKLRTGPIPLNSL